MKRALLVLLLLIVAGLAAFSFWWTSGEPQVEVSDEVIEAAVEDGSGSAQVAVSNPGELSPATLADARQLEGLDTLAQARADLTAELARRDDEDGALHALVSEVCRLQKDSEAALHHAQRSVQLLPTVGAVHWLHARAILLKGYEISRRDGFLAKAEALKLVGPYQDALETAIELNPGLILARKEQAIFTLETPLVGDPEKALELARGIEEDDALEGGLTVARALFKRGDHEDALAKARAVAAAHPTHSDPPWVLGFLLEELDRYDEADVEYAKASSGTKNETYYQALYRRMRLCSKRGQDHERQLALAEEFLEASPTYEFAPLTYKVWTEKGIALNRLGRGPEAREALQEALRLEPGYDRATDELARISD